MTTRSISMVMVALLAVACGKDDKKAEKLEAPPPEAKQVEAKPADAVPAEAARPAKLKPKVLKLTAERQFMFHADTGDAHPIHWDYEGKEVQFSLAHELVGDSIVAKITATMDGKGAEIYKCEGLDPASGGTVEMKASGRNVHIICVNPAHSQDPGSSWGVQLEWNDKKGKLETEGEWEQGDAEGDPDTMDIGEDGMD